jgi:hypothetical protein
MSTEVVLPQLSPLGSRRICVERFSELCSSFGKTPDRGKRLIELYLGVTSDFSVTMTDTLIVRGNPTPAQIVAALGSRIVEEINEEDYR